MSLPALAEELVCARAAGQHVVAVAAEQQGGGQRPVGFVERDRVVAALAEDLDLSGISDRSCAALDGYGPPVHENLPSSIAAGHDRVIEGVTELGSKWAAGENVALIAMICSSRCAVDGIEP